MMRKYRVELILLSFGSAISLGGCQRDHRESEQVNLGINSTINIPLPPCGANFRKPTQAIVLNILQPTDMFNLKGEIIEGKANATATDIDMGQPTVPGASPPSNSYPTDIAPTPLDIWLKLDPNAGSKRDTILVKFAFRDGRMRFRSDEYAIAADAKGKSMLCNLRVAADGTSATVWAKYYSKPNQQGKKTFVGYNLGVYLDQAGGGSVPIFIDPAMGNEG